MVLGKPIVAFDLPEHRITAQDAALYACNNDVKEFADQIQVLMDDPALRKSMGQAGRERIFKELAWNHQKNCLIEAYTRLLG